MQSLRPELNTRKNNSILKDYEWKERERKRTTQKNIEQ